MATYFEILKEVEKEFKGCLDQSVYDNFGRLLKSCEDKVKNGKPLKPQEPDYVAAITSNIANDIKGFLTKKLGGQFRVEMSSFFCHQKPRVNFRATTNPEIGDLLFTVKYTPKVGEASTMSLLLQAKMNDNLGGDQLKLYTEWPDFRYSSKKNKERGYRKVIPKGSHLGAQLLVIKVDEVNNRITQRMRNHQIDVIQFDIPTSLSAIDQIKQDISKDLLQTITPIKSGSTEQVRDTPKTFSQAIIDLFLFNGTVGRKYEDPNEIAVKGWSMVIQDLREMLSGVSTTRKHLKMKDIPRKTSIQVGDVEKALYFFNIPDFSSGEGQWYDYDGTEIECIPQIHFEIVQVQV